jgi:hypothetical protein
MAGTSPAMTAQTAVRATQTKTPGDEPGVLFFSLAPFTGRGWRSAALAR